MMPARSPGANPVRTAAASWGEVSHSTWLIRSPARRLVLDLGHHHAERAGAAVDAASELLGLPRQPVLGHDDGDERLGADRRPASASPASCSFTSRASGGAARALVAGQPLVAFGAVVGDRLRTRNCTSSTSSVRAQAFSRVGQAPALAGAFGRVGHAPGRGG